MKDNCYTEYHKKQQALSEPLREHQYILSREINEKKIQRFVRFDNGFDDVVDLLRLSYLRRKKNKN